MRYLFLFIFTMCALTGEAAPPVQPQPMPGQEVWIERCPGKTVVVARVVNLRQTPKPEGYLQKGDVRVLEMIKGSRRDVPPTVSDFKHSQPVTDALFYAPLQDQMVYLMFFSDVAPYDSRVPELQYDPQLDTVNDRNFRVAVAAAKKYCRS